MVLYKTDIKEFDKVSLANALKNLEVFDPTINKQDYKNKSTIMAALLYRGYDFNLLQSKPPKGSKRAKAPMQLKEYIDKTTQTTGKSEQKAIERLLNKQIKETERAIKKQQNSINKQMKKEQSMLKKAIKKEQAAIKKIERVNKYKPEKMILKPDFVGPLMPTQKRGLTKEEKAQERKINKEIKAMERLFKKEIKNIELANKKSEAAAERVRLNKKPLVQRRPLTEEEKEAKKDRKIPSVKEISKQIEQAKKQTARIEAANIKQQERAAKAEAKRQESMAKAEAKQQERAAKTQQALAKKEEAKNKRLQKMANAVIERQFKQQEKAAKAAAKVATKGKKGINAAIIRAEE